MDGFKDRIASLRKAQGMTQDELATRLGVTYQAVSKWETGSCLPDILLLPKLADIFGTTVDSLLGREEDGPQVVTDSAGSGSDPIDVDVPGNLEIRLLVDGQPYRTISPGDWKPVVIHLSGPVRDVVSEGNLVVLGTIRGDASSGGNLNHQGEILGDAQAGADLHCNGTIGGDAVAGCDLHAGSIGGDAAAGCDLRAGSIGGDAAAGGNLVTDPSAVPDPQS